MVLNHNQRYTLNYATKQAKVTFIFRVLRLVRTALANVVYKNVTIFVFLVVVSENRLCGFGEKVQI